MKEEKMIEATAVEHHVDEQAPIAEPAALATVQNSEDGELMKLTQVPIIIEHLRKIKGEVESRTSTAINLVVTESNYKEIKKVRSAMNKEFAELETKRKSSSRLFTKNASRFRTRLPRQNSRRRSLLSRMISRQKRQRRSESTLTSTHRRSVSIL